jgi:FixJ family two-component response regulator
MAQTIKNIRPTTKGRPTILVVDDEPGLIELFGDVVSPHVTCRVLTAGSIEAARSLLATCESIELLIADVHLPDGDGLTLLQDLKELHPTAAAVVITGQPSVSKAITALRMGVLDFLPKPFNAEQLLERVKMALARQAIMARDSKRLTRLKHTVRQLNISRHVVTKKVDLLCNDLIGAYSELSRQFDAVRIQESFRKLLDEAQDLEQLLCHAMDWILRQSGYCNVAIWLASEDREFELGAYMKYTIPGKPELTEAMKGGLLPMTNRDGLVVLEGDNVKKRLTPTEFAQLNGQTIMSANCTYLGESLAMFVMFRDEKSPFSEDDQAMMKAISPLFATALATIVRGGEGEPEGESEEEAGGSLLDGPVEENPQDKQSNKPRPKKRKDPTSDADWWKRGEPPPF